MTTKRVWTKLGADLADRECSLRTKKVAREQAMVAFCKIEDGRGVCMLCDLSLVTYWFGIWVFFWHKIGKGICKLYGLSLVACWCGSWVLQSANFWNRWFIVIYVAGLSIAHVDFAIFGVVGGVRIVRGVSGAEEAAFAIFGVVGGVNAERVDGAEEVVGGMKVVEVRGVGSTEKEIAIVWAGARAAELALASLIWWAAMCLWSLVLDENFSG